MAFVPILPILTSQRSLALLICLVAILVETAEGISCWHCEGEGCARRSKWTYSACSDTKSEKDSEEKTLPQTSVNETTVPKRAKRSLDQYYGGCCSIYKDGDGWCSYKGCIESNFQCRARAKQASSKDFYCKVGGTGGDRCNNHMLDG